jgi:hypothetical protein
MSEYSRSVDWEKGYEIWENLGRQALEDACKHKTQDKSSKYKETNMRYSGYCEECGTHEDSARPMMNYAYPLYCSFNLDDDLQKILKVVHETNCTVMYNSDEDAYYLALCGGGMDLSQDIAFAYFIMERWIPYALLMNVCTQPELSISGSNWKKLAREMRSQLLHYSKQAISQRKEIASKMSQLKNKKVSKNV